MVKQIMGTYKIKYHPNADKVFIPLTAFYVTVTSLKNVDIY